MRTPGRGSQKKTDMANRWRLLTWTFLHTNPGMRISGHYAQITAAHILLSSPLIMSDPFLEVHHLNWYSEIVSALKAHSAVLIS